jgi:phage tail-like protein
VTHREGGDPSTSRKSPGRTEYDAITLERGVTHDTEFERWANQIWNYDNAQADADQRQQEMALASFRRDLRIVVQNEAGQPVISYKLFRCWASEFSALPELDANANAVAIQSIKIENEGWIREQQPEEPKEPNF